MDGFSWTYDMKIIPFFALLTNSEWFSSSKFDSWSKPSFWDSVAEDREIIICHFLLLLK